jgi:predicted O-methyltransferase YrrM
MGLAIEASPIELLRRHVKRLLREGRFGWLMVPARKGWYYWRSIRELRYVPAVLRRLSQSQRLLSTHELLAKIFSDFGGMFQPFQNRTELERFVERAKQVEPETVLEIGTARGGTLFLLSTVAASNAELISIDLPAGLYGGGYPRWKGRLYRRLMGKKQHLHLIRGNSHERRVFEMAERALHGRKVDLLFIDGDHSYEGAKQDFLQYRTLVRPGGLVAFHDILENKTAPYITVAPLWKEVSGEYASEEIVESYAQGEFGIGVLTAPERWNPAAA